MKKYIAAVLMLIMLLSGCGDSNMYTVKIKTDASGNMTKDFYDSEDKKIKREFITPEGDVDSVFEYFYNEDGLLIKSAYGYEGYSQTTEYAYDADGNNVSAVMSDSDGYTSSLEYTYDENRNKTKTTVKNSDGQDYTINYTYNNEGKLIKEKQTTSKGNNYVSVYTYDENGNNIKKETTDLTGYSSIIEMTYDEKGNIITEKKISSHLNGLSEKETVKVYTYDKNNNLIKEEQTDPEGNKRIEEYTYTQEKVKELE